MRIDYNNDKLKEALKDAPKVYESISAEVSLSDEQKKRFERFLSLPILDKDLLYLHSTKGVAETARLYGCSRRYIYVLIKKINKKLNDESTGLH